MKWYLAIIPSLLLLALPIDLPAQGPPWSSAPAPPAPTLYESQLDRWTDRLLSDLDYLQEELYDRREPEADLLLRQANDAAGAVAHFAEMSRRTNDPRRLGQEFRRMDRALHALIETLERSGSRQIARYASRIGYSDQQIHYLVESRNPQGDELDDLELLQRLAFQLEQQAVQLDRLARRADRFDRADDRLIDEIDDFAEEAREFRTSVIKDTDRSRLRETFRDLDEDWREVVQRLNNRPDNYYLLRMAQRVNLVHNELYEVVTRVNWRDRRSGPRRLRDRPVVQLEIPGLGRIPLR